MEKIAIVTDTTCDLTDEELKKYDIRAIPLQIIYNDKISYRDRYEISLEQIIQDIDNNQISTSLPLAQDITAVMNKLKEEQYTHVLMYPLSAGISGTNNLFRQIATMYEEQMTTYVVESHEVSLSFGYTLLKARELADSGASFEEVIALVEQMKKNVAVNFCVSDLTYLQRGGRISKASQVIGNLFDIIPVIDVTETGALEVIGKVRGEKKSIKTLLRFVEDFVQNKEIEHLFVVHSDRLKNAEVLIRQLTRKFPEAEVSCYRLSSLLTVHTGPGLYGVGVFTK